MEPKNPEAARLFSIIQRRRNVIKKNGLEEVSPRPFLLLLIF
jgi:hypothetical protein